MDTAKNVIATFRPGENTARITGLWQWDYGQKLEIHGLELPKNVSVEYSLNKSEPTKDRIGITENNITVVDIPNEIMELHGDLKVYIRITHPESGSTEYIISGKIKEREKPSECPEPEPEMESLFGKTIEAVNEAAERAEDAEKSAESWAHGHEDYPERDEDNAAYYARIAGGNAASAHDSMAEAQYLASQVHSDADIAAQNTMLAEQYKSQAAQSAAEALKSENNANDSKKSAQESLSGAEAAEGQAELFAQQVATDKHEVELIKSEIARAAQKITEDKNTVQRLADDFTITHQQAIADINNAGQAQTERVENAGEAAVDEIETSRQQAVNSVSDEGESQKNAVKSEGTTQVSNVQAAAEEITGKVEQIDQNTKGISELKGDLGVMQDTTMIVTKSTNLYDESKATDGYRIAGGGSVVTQDGSVLSDFIEIPDGMSYAVPCAYFNNGYKIFSYTHGFYDSDKKSISGSGSPATSGIPLPSGAKYFRASWLKDTTSQRFINFNTNGSLFPYEEYYDSIREVKTSKEVVEKLDNYENRISALENLNETPVNRVICWGDSLTDGAGASDTAHQYPFVLKSLINGNNNGIVTDSAGQGGEGTYSIATRQGGVVVNVKPCTIPSSGSVNIEIDKWNGLIISLCRRGGNNVTADNAKMKINPCYIAGVKGTLLRDNDGKYVFTRAEVGEEVTFTRPVPLLTDAHENYNGEDEVAIIWSGTNDTAENGGTIEKTIQGINMMIARLKSNKYIVVGLTSKAYHPDIDDKNFRMATEYKDHFVNVRDYMLAYGLEDSGITATEQDLTDIENGEIPTSLRADDVHGNDYFYDIVAKLVYKKGKKLVYWN